MAITDPMRQFDSRTVRRKIKSGRISEAEYREFLTTLPDVSDNIRSRDDGGDDDGYEERIANRGRPREIVREFLREPGSEGGSPFPPLTIRPAPPSSALDDDDDDDDLDDDDDDDDDLDDADDLFASPASPSTPVAAPKPPVIPPASSPLKTPSFDLPPLDPPSNPDDEE